MKDDSKIIKIHKIPTPIRVPNWPKPSEKPIPVEIPEKTKVPASK